MKRSFNKVMKLIILLILLILSMMIYGCKNSKNEEVIKEFENYIIQEDYVYAAKLYNDNSDNNKFIEKSDEILDSLVSRIIEDINQKSLPNAKAFVEFVDSIKGESFGADIIYKIEEIETEIAIQESESEEAYDGTSNEEDEITIQTVLNNEIVIKRMIKQFNNIYFEGECYVDYKEKFNFNESSNEVFKGIDDLKGKDVYIVFAGRHINHIVDRENGTIYEVSSMEWTDNGKVYNLTPLEVNIKDII